MADGGTTERNIYAYFIPALPVSTGVAVKLLLGVCLLLTVPIWGAACLILGLVWLAWALGKSAVELGEKSFVTWAKGKANEDSAGSTGARGVRQPRGDERAGAEASRVQT